MTEELPALYVVPTPLGNLADMTQRAIDVLRRVPWVAAEDTRHSAPLLKHYGAGARLLPAHEHNEEGAAQQVIGKLAAGESVALVSDAGTPAVSDPGARLVARVRAAGWEVVNIDATLICKAPRILPHAPAMVANLAADLDMDAAAINIKGKTTEKLGFTGRGEGIAAQVVALITRAGQG